MGIDPEISKWVLEFFLRQQTLEDRALNSLLEILPIPHNDNNLQKLILLKELESQASSNSISVDMLDVFEGIDEIESKGGVRTVSDSMKRAYCAVAVESTVKHWDGDCNSGSFFVAVKRVWKGRMEKVVRNGRLSSDDLLRWKNKLEAAVWEDDACERVVRRCNEEINAVDAVCVYVREEKEKMGPSFLELVAAKVKDGENVRGTFGVDEVSSGVCFSVDADKEMHKDDVQTIKKCNGMKRSRRLTTGSRGVRIVDPDENPIGPSQVNDILPDKEELNRIRKALDSRSLELQVVVRDPLHDTLQHAEETFRIARKNETHDPVEKNNHEANVSTMDCGGAAQGSGCDMSNSPRPIMMEHCDSVHAYESDDSIDASPERENSGNCRDMLSLASPTLLDVSPLNSYDSRNRKKRRKARKWSAVEEDALRAGVQRYGQGSWKMILTAYRDILLYRTEIDLKDKWRNLTRR